MVATTVKKAAGAAKAPNAATKGGAAKAAPAATKAGAAKAAPVKDKKPAALLKGRKRLAVQRSKTAAKRKSFQAKMAIVAMKNKGGTVRFVRDLKSIRQKAVEALRLKRQLVRRGVFKAAKKAATKALDGKTNKDGKKVAPHVRKEPKFQVKRMRKYYKTQLDTRKLPSKNFFPDMKENKKSKRPHLRRSLVPGTVCIVLAGRYKSRRVVFLKQLKTSGLCLVTGPYNVNGVPLRRMSQNYLIATSVRVDSAGLKVPKEAKDAFFNRKKEPKKTKKTPAGEEEIFKKKAPKKIKPTKSQRRVQKEVDKNLMSAIRKRKDHKLLIKYLERPFGLCGRRFIHNMNF